MSPKRNTDSVESAFDLVVESIYRAAAGDIDWNDALATIARARGAERAMLFTPGLAAADGGLSASFDGNHRRTALHAVSPAPVPKGSPEPSYSVAIDGGGDAAVPPTLFVLFRGRAASAPDPAEHEALEAIARHLSLGVRLWYRARTHTVGPEALASCLHAAAVLVDATLHVKWMNASAARLAREGVLALSKDRLLAIPGVDGDLMRLVRDAAGSGALSGVASVNGTGILELAPVKGAATGMGLVLLTLRCSTNGREAAAALAANYRLTATEVDLAIALWKGILIAEYAEMRSVAMSTVRTQLKALLSKTGARRQSDVVAIVARLLPLTRIPQMDDD